MLPVFLLAAAVSSSQPEATPSEAEAPSTVAIAVKAGVLGLGGSLDVRAWRDLHIGGDAFAWLGGTGYTYESIGVRASYRLYLSRFLIAPSLGVSHVRPRPEAGEFGTIQDYRPLSPVAGLAVGIRLWHIVIGFEGQVTQVSMHATARSYGAETTETQKVPLMGWFFVGAEI